MHAKTLGLILKKQIYTKYFYFYLTDLFTAEFNKNRIGSVWYLKELAKKLLNFLMEWT